MSESRPVIMISSVVEGFREFRVAAGQGIVDGGGHPLMANENFPSLTKSSRNACLDAVASSDALVVVIGERGGYKTPSGATVVAEECAEAQRLSVPILAFIQSAVERDEDAANLVNALSNYVSGYFRRQFSTPDALQRDVKAAVEHFRQSWECDLVDADALQRVILERASTSHGNPALRLVFSPERQDELVDPMTMESKEFHDLVYSIAHRPDVGLLSYEHAKRPPEIRSGALIFHQTDPHRHRGPEVLIVIDTTGAMRIDCDAVYEPNNTALGGMTVRTSTLSRHATSAFVFYHFLLESLDPYHRCQRVLYNAAISGLEYRAISTDESSQQTTIAVQMTPRPDPLIAFDVPRRVARTVVLSPDQEVQRIVLRLRQKAHG